MKYAKLTITALLFIGCCLTSGQLFGLSIVALIAGLKAGSLGGVLASVVGFGVSGLFWRWAGECQDELTELREC